MSTGSAKMTSGGASGLAAYLMEEELAGYYVERDHRSHQSFGETDRIFAGRQLHGAGWHALGHDLGLDGLTFGQFRDLTTGHHPVTHDQLVRPGHRKVVDSATGAVVVEQAHTMAIDTFYAAPKSVSVLCVAAAEAGRLDLVRRIIAAQEIAVREAHHYVETEALLGRRTIKTPSEVKQLATNGARLVTKPGHERYGQQSKQQGSQSARVPVDLLGISVTQHTARPNDKTISEGRLPDPHLHTHDVQIAMGYDEIAKKWVTIDDYGLKTTAKRRDADYMGALARELQAAGVELEFREFEGGRNGRLSWRVKGITAEAEKFFSSNHARAFALREELETISGNAVSEKALQLAMRKSRRRKDVKAKQQDSAPVYDQWAEEARAAGKDLVDSGLAKRLRGGDQTEVAIADWPTRRREFFRRFYGEAGVAREESEFSGRDVAEAISRCAEGLSFTVEDRMSIELEVMGQLRVQEPSVNPAKVRYTTEAMLGAELDVAGAFASKAQSFTSHHPGRVEVASAIQTLGIELEPEQLCAVRHATSGRRLTIVEGLAGAGKTTALRAVVNAGRIPKANGESAYDQIIVVSTAALTARGTAEKIGADVGCSVKSFIYRVNKGTIKVTDRTLLIHDEAPVANTWMTQELLKAAGHAQIVMVGDPEQAQAIGPGGTFQDAVALHGAARLTTVFRHSDPRDTRAFGDLRNGRPELALASLEQRQRFHVADSNAERVDAAISMLKSYRDAGRSATDVRLLFDSSNHAIDEANRHVQRDRLARGEINDRAVVVEDTDQNRRWSLHANDLVIFLQPTKGRETLVPNGSTGTVLAVNPATCRVTIALDENESSKAALRKTAPRIVTVDLQPNARHQPIGLAYAVHVAKYQGSEVPIVLALPGGRGTTNKNSAYSILTRCIDEVHVFVDKATHGQDPAKTLKELWSMGVGKKTASSRGRAHDEQTHNAKQLPAAGSHEVSPAPTTGLVLKDATYHRVLERVAGPAVFESIEKAEAYPALIAKLESLRNNGRDAADLLARAVRERELTSAADPAAVLTWRVERLAQPSPYKSIELPPATNPPHRTGTQDDQTSIQRPQPEPKTTTTAMETALRLSREAQERRVAVERHDIDLEIDRSYGWSI